MRSIHSWVGVVLALLACGFAAGAAHAQSESKTWYVPWAWSVPASAQTGSITVVNLNGQPVRVNVRVFNAQGAALATMSSAFSLPSAASSSYAFPMDPRGSVAASPAFVLVLADEPVLVHARASVVSSPLIEVDRDCRRISSRGSPNGVLHCDGQLGRYDANGEFQHDSLEPWRYAGLQEWPAFPIDCAGRASTHFACSQRVARELPGGDVGGPTPVDRVERETDPDR